MCQKKLSGQRSKKHPSCFEAENVYLKKLNDCVENFSKWAMHVRESTMNTVKEQLSAHLLKLMEAADFNHETAEDAGAAEELKLLVETVKKAATTMDDPRLRVSTKLQVS